MLRQFREQLAPLEVKGVLETEEELGRGSYGDVRVVKIGRLR